MYRSPQQTADIFQSIVMNHDEVDIEKISVGCIVTVFDFEFNEEIEFAIVGSTESNSLQNRISNESPVGAALLGKRIGEMVEVETQVGDFQYKVISIRKSN